MRGEQVIYLESRIFCFDKKQIKPKDQIIRMSINIKTKLVAHIKIQTTCNKWQVV